MTNSRERKKLVEVKHLKQYFGSKKNVVKAIDDISFDIFEGETFGLVKSGSGNQRRDVPCFVYTGQLKAKFSSKERYREFEKKEKLLEFRKRSANDFPDPYTSLDGRMKVRDIIAEGIDIHGLAKATEERDAIIGWAKQLVE